MRCIIGGQPLAGLAAEGGGRGRFPVHRANDFHLNDEGCVPFFKGVVEKMKEASPDSNSLLGGDLVEKGMAKEFDTILPVVKAAGMMIKMMCGNHDWPNNNERKAFLEACPDRCTAKGGRALEREEPDGPGRCSLILEHADRVGRQRSPSVGDASPGHRPDEIRSDDDDELSFRRGGSASSGRGSRGSEGRRGREALLDVVARGVAKQTAIMKLWPNEVRPLFLRGGWSALER